MYYDYFNLKQPPFKITPDTSLFFPGGDRGAILDALIYAIVSGEGIVKLVGEVGSGKTTLCRMLEKELPDNIEIVYLANPSLSPDNILHAIAFELNLKVRPDDTRLKVMNSLQNYLLERHAENKQIVVFVEEAQSMPIATLEEIRLLSNLETAQNKLLQIVIFGQPELDVMISKQEIRQLKERITYSFYLSPLKPNEVKDYINSRLRSCGYRSAELFNDKAIKTISKYSNGLLRRINILADKSLLACYAANANTVTPKHVELAARETEFVNSRQKITFRWGLVGLAITVIVLLLISFPAIKYSLLPLTESISGNASVAAPVENSDVPVVLSGQVDDDLDADAVQINEQLSASAVNNAQLSDNAVEGENPGGTSALETPAWQITEQEVIHYPDTIKPAVGAKPLISNTANESPDIELLEIRDLMKSVSGHSDDEMALLKQLAILPAETAINDETMAGELTCKLCSTIIYRPVKDDKKL